MGGKADFDTILEKIGTHGKYQLYHYILLGLAILPAGMHHLASVFTVGVPDHWCHIPQLDNLTGEQQKTLAIPIGPKGLYSKCEKYDINYTASLALYSAGFNHTFYNENTTKSACSQWEFHQKDFGKTTVVQWDLVCGESWKRALTQSIYMLGILLGAIIFGSLSDIFGRKVALLLSAALAVLAGFGSVYAPEFWSHNVFRCCQAAATTGMITCAFVLVMEIIGVHHRMVPGIFIQAWFAIGYMLLAAIAYFVRDYENLLLIISLFPIIYIPYYWLIEESPRWLICRGKIDAAESAIKKAAKMNGLAYTPAVMTILHSDYKPGTVEGNTHNYTIVDLLRTPNMRKKSINIFFNWAVNSFVYYGLSLGVSDLGGSPYLNLFISGIMECLGCLVAALTLDRIGRRLPLAGLMVGGGFFCMITAAVPTEMTILRSAFAMIGKLGISGSFAVIYVFSAELFPTVVRNMGVGAGSMHSRIGGMIAPFVATLGPTVWGPLPVLLFGSSSVVAGLLALLLPETLNQHLPETLEDGENFGKKGHVIKTEELNGNAHGDQELL